ncbi:hypothetical protein WJX73_007044 [Symbiochloris irregularis]|uniref:non-specific serine/threonine protein kinase n=1 Tax=Symbiochloris irregularis TaxID=706552 RepID=A0AAW1P2X6_9CHLO
MALAHGKDKHDDDDAFPTPPAKVTVGGSPQFLVHQQLGKGGFGQVLKGVRAFPRASKDPHKPMHVAIKFEHKTSKGLTSKGVPYEWDIYQQLGDTPGLPMLLHKGFQDNFCVMIMELLGKSLWDICNVPHRTSLSEQYAACVAVECLSILEGIHEKGYVHGDVKPENLCLGAEVNGSEKKLFLVDLGLASKWRNQFRHLEYSQRPDDFRGTIRYASVHAHLGRQTSRRDDLESLGYTLIFLLNGELPWQGFTGDNKGFLVAKQKVSTSLEALCSRCSPPFQQFLEYAISLSFKETPNYKACQKLFEPLLGDPSTRKLAVDYGVHAGKVGQKRQRHPSFEETAMTHDLTLDKDGNLRKKLRTGFPAQQFLTIYDHRDTQKQRYHYNVSTTRLDTHISVGRADNLVITAVASYNELWLVVMDADPRVKDQRHIVTDNSHLRTSRPSESCATELLPREWISQYWDRGYFITAIAGSKSWQAMVVMTKGRPYQQQSYKVSAHFPCEWVRRKHSDGFMVTCCATIGSRDNYYWVVVVTAGAGFETQAVELDFVYPSEAIHHYWDRGYRITSVGASPDQIAVVMSLAPGYAAEAPQETLRTSTFPATHIKEKWDKDLYIAAACFGPMVS